MTDLLGFAQTIAHPWASKIRELAIGPVAELICENDQYSMEKRPCAVSDPSEIRQFMAHGRSYCPMVKISMAAL
jgi:hypothetical protein